MKNTDFSPSVDIQEIRFKIDRLSYNLCWPVRMEQDQRYLDHAANTAFARLTRDLPYLGSGPVVEAPLNWWEAVKERWMPRALLRRFPVKCRRWEATHYFPNLPASDKFKDSFSVFIFQPEPIQDL